MLVTPSIGVELVFYATHGIEKGFGVEIKTSSPVFFDVTINACASMKDELRFGSVGLVDVGEFITQSK